MGHGKPEYHLHLVWSTYQREPLLVGDVEALIYACLRAELRRMTCIVLAIGGIEDHIHLVVEPPTLLGPAQVMKQIKGASSRFAAAKGFAFKWQAGYGVFSLSRPHLKSVVPYVQNQKLRHAAGILWPDWEPSDV